MEVIGDRRENWGTLSVGRWSKVGALDREERLLRVLLLLLSRERIMRAVRCARLLRDQPTRIRPTVPQLPNITERVHAIARVNACEQVGEMRVLLVCTCRSARCG